MPEEHNIRIQQWPKQKAQLEHHFQLEEPCPISVTFEDKPVQVVLGGKKGEAVKVDMNMRVSAREPFPVCIKLCDPICATSDYEIGIQLLGQPLASIAVRGKTKLSHDCEDPAPVERNCLSFDDVKPNQEFPGPYLEDIVSIHRLGDSSDLRFVQWLPLPTPPQLWVIPEGVRIKFERAVNNVALRMANGSTPVANIQAFLAGVLVYSTDEIVPNSPKEINIPVDSLDIIEIRTDSKELTLVELCYATA